MARGRTRTFNRGPRRATDWSASAELTAMVSLAGGASALSEVFTPLAGGETIIRTRGIFAWTTDNDASAEEQLGAFGIAVVSEPAATVGITAIPTPVVDAAWGGWLYHTYFASRTAFATAVGKEYDAVHQIVIDSKAMRKVDEDDRVVMVVENASPDGMKFWNSERILTKVH